MVQFHVKEAAETEEEEASSWRNRASMDRRNNGVLQSSEKQQSVRGFVNPRIIKHGRIFKTKIMGSPTIVVNGTLANGLILSNEFNLVVSSWPSSSVQLMGMNCIMAKQGEKHCVLRGIVANSLRYNGLEFLAPKLCDTVRFHLETEWRGKEEISLYRSIKALTFTVVFECLYVWDQIGAWDVIESLRGF